MTTLNRAARRRAAKDPPPVPQPDEQAAQLVPSPQGDEQRDAYFLTPLEARVLLEAVGKMPLDQVLGAWATMKRQFETNMRTRAASAPPQET